MDAITLWDALRLLHSERVERVSEKLGAITGDASSLVQRLDDLRQGASIANERCGYVGNPYEQVAEDLEVLVCVAKRDF